MAMMFIRMIPIIVISIIVNKRCTEAIVQNLNAADNQTYANNTFVGASKATLPPSTTVSNIPELKSNSAASLSLNGESNFTTPKNLSNESNSTAPSKLAEESNSTAPSKLAEVSNFTTTENLGEESNFTAPSHSGESSTRRITTKTTTAKLPLKRKTVITIFLSHSNPPHDKNGALSAVNVAMKQINARTDILKDYKLKVFVIKPFADGDFYRKIFFWIDRFPNPMLILGPIQSSILESSYPAFVETSILQINPNGISEKFASVQDFPYLFSTCQLEDILYPAMLQLLKHFNWNRIGLVYMKNIFDSFYSLGASHFETYATKEGIEFATVRSLLRILSSEANNEDRLQIIRDELEIIKETDVRVIVLMVNRRTLASLFCEAYNMGMYGKKYVYINFFGEQLDNWIDAIHFPTFKCTREQMYMINKNLIFQHRAARGKDGSVTIGSQTVEETWTLIKNELKRVRGKLFRHRDQLFYLYDSVWAFALALNRVVEKNPDYVERYSWNTNNMTRKQMFAEQFNKLEFEGSSGTFKYTIEDGQRYRYGSNVQYKIVREVSETSSQYIDIGSISTPTNLGRNTSTSIYVNVSMLSYPIPSDRPAEFRYPKQFPTTLLVVIWVVSLFGILCSIIFLIVNMHYGNVKFMKLSSPNINSLICVGCILFFTAVVCNGIDSRFITNNNISTMCNVTILLISMGFTLTFGSLFSKTWRIYRIFSRSQSLRYVVIKDVHLFSVVMLLVFIDVVIFFLWIAVSPFTLYDQVIHTKELEDVDVIETEIIHRCQCEFQQHFVSAIFVYKGLLVLFGLFVAYETKTIKVEAINDSKHIGLAIYNFSVVLTLSGIVTYFLYDTEHYIESYVIFATSICEVTITTLFLVFIPKIIMLSKNYDDPNFRNGRPVMNSNTSRSDANHTNSHTQSQSQSNSHSEAPSKKGARSDSYNEREDPHRHH